MKKCCVSRRGSLAAWLLAPVAALIFAAAVSALRAETEDEANRATPVVGIILYEGTATGTVETLFPALEKTFQGVRFEICETGLRPPDGALDEKRSRYYAPALLRELAEKKMKAKEYVRLIGIADFDVYAGKEKFLFGLSWPEDDVALVSSSRLGPREDKLFAKRLLTVVVHELGHTFVLEHCAGGRCAMAPVTWVEALDSKGPELCPLCARRLREALAAENSKESFLSKTDSRRPLFRERGVSEPLPESFNMGRRASRGLAAERSRYDMQIHNLVSPNVFPGEEHKRPSVGSFAEENILVGNAEK